MPYEFTACRRHARLVLVALTAIAAGCATPPPVPRIAPAPLPMQQQPLAAEKAPAAAPPVRVSVIDGYAWSPAIAAVTQGVQQAALANGDVEVIRTDDNRLLIRAGTNVVFERRGAVVRARFRTFAGALAEVLSGHPSVLVQVVGYGDDAQATPSGTKQPLVWARAVLRVLSHQRVGAERLTARARSNGDAIAVGEVLPQAPHRRIEIVLSDPLI